MQRIAVIGTAGSGKTTLAQQLAALHGLAFVELDALFWGPGWTPAAPDVFRARVAEALAGSAWAVGGALGRWAAGELKLAAVTPSPLPRAEPARSAGRVPPGRRLGVAARA